MSDATTWDGERVRLVVVREAATVEAETRREAEDKFDRLSPSDWHVVGLSRIEAVEQIRDARSSGEALAKAQADYEAKAWRFVAFCFMAVAFLKTIGVSP